MDYPPGTVVKLLADGFRTGLAGTIGLRVRDGLGNDAIARFTAGIVEDIAGTGIYRTTVVAPAAYGQYFVVWDDGAGIEATDSFFVTAPPVAAAAVPSSNRIDLRADRGSTIEFLVTVSNADGSPVDLTVPGTTLTVTAKLTPDDAAPLFTKNYIQGNAGASQITVTGASHNVADVVILPADTEALPRSCYVMIDAVLLQPSGKETTVARGVIKVRASIGA